MPAAAVAIEDGRIAWVGPEAELPAAHAGVALLHIPDAEYPPYHYDPHRHMHRPTKVQYVLPRGITEFSGFSSLFSRALPGFNGALPRLNGALPRTCGVLAPCARY